MSYDLIQHVVLTNERSLAYKALFGEGAVEVAPFTDISDPDDPWSIDVFLYAPVIEGRKVLTAVTNGLSDYPMRDPRTGKPVRWEMIQYLAEWDIGLAQRLYNCGWLPLFDKFHIDFGHWITAPPELGYKLPVSLFLAPAVLAHRDFEMTIEGDPVRFLWHVPLTLSERDFLKTAGQPALMERMRSANLPWVFEDGRRPII